jgi:hypothetical protein
MYSGGIPYYGIYISISEIVQFCLTVWMMFY